MSLLGLGCERLMEQSLHPTLLQQGQHSGRQLLRRANILVPGCDSACLSKDKSIPSRHCIYVQFIIAINHRKCYWNTFPREKNKTNFTHFHKRQNNTCKQYQTRLHHHTKQAEHRKRALVTGNQQRLECQTFQRTNPELMKFCIGQLKINHYTVLYMA